MIASLRGQLTHKDAQGAIVECAGVGYGVAMSLAALEKIGDLGETVRLLIYTHVTQDSLRLYGFLEAAERRVFELLIGISGVGPKLALAVMSTFSSQELADVVSQGDVAALVRVPGVGKKTAERLGLELRDRLPKVVEAAATSTITPSRLMDDLLSALANLGFSNPVAQKAAKKALSEDPEQTDVAVLVRTALRITTRL